MYLFLPIIYVQADPSLLGDYDFSGAKGELVASIPGWHKGASLSMYGHMRLRSLLSSFVWPSNLDCKDDGIDYQVLNPFFFSVYYFLFIF